MGTWKWTGRSADLAQLWGALPEWARYWIVSAVTAAASYGLTWISGLDPALVALIAVLLVGALLWGARQALNLLRPSVGEKPESSGQAYSPPPATKRYFRGETIRIADLVSPGDYRIVGKTFEDCEILGPAVMVVGGVGILHQCGFDGDAATTLWVVENRQVVGAIHTVDTVFRRCRFRSVGIAGSAETIEQVKRGFTGQ